MKPGPREKTPSPGTGLSVVVFVFVVKIRKIRWVEFRCMGRRSVPPNLVVTQRYMLQSGYGDSVKLNAIFELELRIFAWYRHPRILFEGKYIGQSAGIISKKKKVFDALYTIGI